jgi:aminocarboxymuconate-semialdehyde decarboxylase
MPVVDLHAHWFPQSWVDLLVKEGAENGAKMAKTERGNWQIDIAGVALKSIFRPDMIDPAIMLKNMDGAKVDARAMSLTNPMVYWAPPAFGLKLSQVYNDASSELHRAHPDRFLGTIMLPLQAPELAVKELDRAAKLPGMKAVYMAMHVGGRNIDDKPLWPVYERAQALGLPLCLHPVNPLAGERMGEYHMRNLCGNPMEAGIAAGALIFGGVLDAFPKLEVMLPHAGGPFPWLIGRFDHGAAVRKELKHMKRPPSDYLRRFHYDTVSHEPRIIRFLIDLVGADRVVLGSDYNFDMGYEQPVDFVEQIPGLTEKERKLILRENAARLLRL